MDTGSIIVLIIVLLIFAPVYVAILSASAYLGKAMMVRSLFHKSKNKREDVY